MIARKADPLGCSSGYTIHAYCQYDNPDHAYRGPGQLRGSDEFFGRNERDARKGARQAGWLIDKDWFAICPLCRKELKK